MKNLVVLSAFLLLCLVSLVFLVASGFLETGKIDKHQWYRITADKVLSVPLALINSLLQRKPEEEDESASKDIHRDN